jgi:hypothetical protein
MYVGTIQGKAFRIVKSSAVLCLCGNHKLSQFWKKGNAELPERKKNRN